MVATVVAPWGGLTLTISGTGKVDQKSVRIENGFYAEELNEKQMQDLVALLLEIRAWDQVTPNRDPVSDESKATLTIQVGTTQTSIWEWFNDLEKNNRIIRVIALMKKFSWD